MVISSTLLHGDEICQKYKVMHNVLSIRYVLILYGDKQWFFCMVEDNALSVWQCTCPFIYDNGQSPWNACQWHSALDSCPRTAGAWTYSLVNTHRLQTTLFFLLYFIYANGQCLFYITQRYKAPRVFYSPTLCMTCYCL